MRFGCIIFGARFGLGKPSACPNSIQGLPQDERGSSFAVFAVESWLKKRKNKPYKNGRVTLRLAFNPDITFAIDSML